MRKYSQAGALFVLVVLPVLVFVFLKVFGRNHFEVPRYNPLVDAAGKTVKVGKDTVFRAVEACEMYNEKDQKVGVPASESISVIVFLDDICDANCQKRQKQLLRVQEMFANNPEVKLFAITDSTLKNNLRDLALKAKANPAKWFFLRANPKRVERLKSEEIFLKNPRYAKTFEFKKSFILIDKERYVRGFYDGTNPEDADRLTVEIKILLDNYKE